MAPIIPSHGTLVYSGDFIVSSWHEGMFAI